MRIILLLLTLSAFYLHGHSFQERILMVVCSLPDAPEGYRANLYTTLADPAGGRREESLRSFNTYYDGGRKTVECEIWNFDDYFTDTLVRIRYTIDHYKREGTYVHLDTIITIKDDTVWFEIPPVDEEAAIAWIEKINREYNEEHRGEDFKAFISEWPSRFIYIGYYQGFRPYAEILAGPAYYSDLPSSLNPFSNWHYEPGVILGPQLGTEVNFNWDPDKLIIGPKIGMAFSVRYFNLGLHFIYYTDFEKGSLFLTPRMGIGLGSPFVNFAYAYSMRLGKDKFGSAVNRHQFCLIFNIPLKRVDTR